MQRNHVRVGALGSAKALRMIPEARSPARLRSRPLRQVARAAEGQQQQQQQAEPMVSITFLDKEGTKVEVQSPSGEQLRATMMENKVDLYTTWGKIWSCGGVGQCGTCIVKVDEGADLLSERTATEDKKLRGKPESWRLACQTIVGDGKNTGKVIISTKPQG